MENVENIEEINQTEDKQSVIQNEEYFTSYEDLEIHRLMLKDKTRTEAYRNAILNNREYFQGKTVMDIGAGTGILSLFCAQAGAEKVYAVEASRLAETIVQVVEKNGFSHIIQVIHGKAEEIDLPDGIQVDIIVSEWMGFYLLHESMLDSVIKARDKHLKPEGVMLPSRAILYSAACHLSDFYQEHIDFWEDVYGLNLTPFAEEYLHGKRTKPEILQLKGEDLLSDPIPILDIDLAWVGLDEIQSIEKKCFTSISPCNPLEYQGICLWFDCYFELGHGSETVILSTSPRSETTHWKQCVILLPSSITVEEGDIVAWQLKIEQSIENRRHYVMELNLLDPESEEHPLPCCCGRAKCVIIAAYLQKEEQQWQEEEGVQLLDIS